jgi:hypothetical protein
LHTSNSWVFRLGIAMRGVAGEALRHRSGIRITDKERRFLSYCNLDAITARVNYNKTWQSTIFSFPWLSLLVKSL